MAELNRAIKARPDDLILIGARADVAARARKTAQATADYALLRSRAAGDAAAFNSLCWGQATRDFDLPTALADCDRALAINPKFSHAVDSRAFVLMRMGRLPEALAGYDAALALRPDWPETRLGRGLTRRLMGQTAEGQADIDAALKAQPRLGRVWSQYGLVVAPSPPPAPSRTAAAETPVAR